MGGRRMETGRTEETQVPVRKTLTKVLLVEDNRVDRRLVERLLSTCSHPVKLAVESVETVSAAVECLNTGEYDLVLLDLNLPDSSGVETVRRVNEIEPPTPIVVLTGADDEETALLAIRSGAEDYLVKGQFSSNSLIRTIVYALEREKGKKLILDSNRQLQETSQRLFIAKKELEEKTEALQEAHAKLELRVEERTAELSKTNELLKKEVTKREHAEEALQASEANLRKVILSSPDGIVIVDKDGITQFTNPAVESFFGCKEEDLLGGLFGLPLMKGEAIEVDIVRRDQEPGIAEMRVVETEWNGQSAYLVLLSDITERKHAREQIVHAAREWRTTFDSITDMISIHDKDCKITRVNMALADALNTTPKELIGKMCYEIFHGTQKPGSNCPHLHTFETKEPATLEFFSPRLGIHLGESTSPIFDDNGAVTGTVHIAKDITKRKQAEDKLKRANERLKEYNWLKDELLSTASHELRTPLSVIMGAIRLVLDEIPGKIVVEQREILSMARDNAQRLSRIINSLLNVSTMESGGLNLQTSVVDISKLIKDTVSDYKSVALEKGICLDCEVPQETVNIRLDPDRAVEILTNLISNSLKFTPEGGWVKVICTKQNEEILVSVRDSGVGIAQEDIPRLFDKFTQFGREAGPGEKGTGLGLAIVKKLVEMHNGRIEVESEMDKGTTVNISLPFMVGLEAEDISEETDELLESTHANN
jgi:PAS domain S-box-containing protein